MRVRIVSNENKKVKLLNKEEEFINLLCETKKDYFGDITSIEGEYNGWKLTEKAENALLVWLSSSDEGLKSWIKNGYPDPYNVKAYLSFSKTSDSK